jgi:hypothetical protein
MTCKIWQCQNERVKQNKWNFQPRKSRGQVSEIAPSIKSLGVGSKIFKLGRYEGTLEELKEFAALKGIATLRMGAVNIRTA